MANPSPPPGFTLIPQAGLAPTPKNNVSPPSGFTPLPQSAPAPAPQAPDPMGGVPVEQHEAEQYTLGGSFGDRSMSPLPKKFMKDNPNPIGEGLSFMGAGATKGVGETIGKNLKEGGGKLLEESNRAVQEAKYGYTLGKEKMEEVGDWLNNLTTAHHGKEMIQGLAPHIEKLANELPPNLGKEAVTKIAEHTFGHLTGLPLATLNSYLKKLGKPPIQEWIMGRAKMREEAPQVSRNPTLDSYLARTAKTKDLYGGNNAPIPAAPKPEFQLQRPPQTGVTSNAQAGGAPAPTPLPPGQVKPLGAPAAKLPPQQQQLLSQLNSLLGQNGTSLDSLLQQFQGK